MKENECMLTTTDNPYDPFTQFESWFAFDEQKGYHSCGLLARLALTSPKLSDEQNEKAVSDAINNIIILFPGIYKRVYKTN